MAAIEYREMRKKAMEEARRKMMIERQNETISESINDLTVLQRISNAPTAISYGQNKLSQQKCDQIISFCENRSSWEAFGEWGHIGGRSVMILGGIPHPNGAIVEELPPLFKSVADSLKSHFDGKSPNQILLNSYEVGQGIAHHNDGELYASQVAIISLQSSAKIDFKRTNPSSGTETDGDTNTTQRDSFSLYLHPNSLLLFGNSAYTDYTHGIEPVTSDTIDKHILNAGSDLSIGICIPRTTKRYSLTFRIVENVVVTLDEFGSCTEDMRDEVKRRKAWWLHAITEKH
jgi:alkylated DNA repair dioxygenase AlkB